MKIFILPIFIIFIFPLSSLAYFAQPLVPGSGSNPTSEISGDTGLSPAISSGQIESTSFQQKAASSRTTVYLYLSGSKTAKLMYTLRPDTLTVAQAQEINNILSQNILTKNQSIIKINISIEQMESIQKVLIPTARRSADEPLYIYAESLPAVKIFAKWFVTLGVVFATVFLAFASFSIVNGEMRSGHKVISTAAGLILLLMSYTIYKIAILNILHKNSTNISTIELVPSTSSPLQISDSPTVPKNWQQFPSRSGIPVQPLSGN